MYIYKDMYIYICVYVHHRMRGQDGLHELQQNGQQNCASRSTIRGALCGRPQKAQTLELGNDYTWLNLEKDKGW